MRVFAFAFMAGLLAPLAACGAPPSTAANGPEADVVEVPEARAAFNAAAWSAVVNASPCDWLPEAFISARIDPASPGIPETSRTETACVWRNPDGTARFTAAVVSFDSAANLTGERRAQLQEVQAGSGFRQMGEADGVVTSILRSDRIRLMMFPNSDEETAVIVLSGHPVMSDPAEVRGEKTRRVEDFAMELARVHGL